MEEDDVIAEEEREAGTMAGNNLHNRKYQECTICKDVICWECADEGSVSGGGCGEMICDDCAFYDCAFCGGRLCNVCAEYIGSVSVLALINQMGFLTRASVNYDSIANSIDLGYDDGECYEVKIAEGRKRKGIDPLAMRALFGERFSLCEIHNVMERDGAENTYKEGWLKRVLEESNDYDIPELIDPDEYEEWTPDLVPSDEDGAGIPGRVGSDNDGGAMPVLFESEADSPLVGPMKRHRSIGGLTRMWNMSIRTCEDTDEAKSIPCSYKRQGDLRQTTYRRNR